MEKLVRKHVFAYWQIYRKKNKKASYDDIDAMAYFMRIAKEHILHVLRPGMVLVYNNGYENAKSTIISIDRPGEKILTEDMLIDVDAVYYVANN